MHALLEKASGLMETIIPAANECIVTKSLGLLDPLLSDASSCLARTDEETSPETSQT